ncbi:tRNA (adenosine(37)-N6)-threonylcarbamoyltransferase complex ATPase subunit type 1 TsaE [Tabrizicola aquatica]|uniref:tRNA (adenosine(37)-N6)-threonylcarbamoyltransferase complex ATPase subunit type 1 TsaE n=1 Tax=Tabrizicola aquatica TaxID=909926 RepID=UPI000CCFD8E7|nr:tRNA (adenosine(37)-N6)-threonylcarbamoyltransferase complex ATPase subunit type 1 TsaE [Tabrizicola aquatica]
MTLPDTFTLDLPDETATAALGARLAAVAQAGDVILLSGAIGAGKSHLARAFIRARLGQGEEVPSPTFTLIQTYGPPDAEIFHADLYRLTHPDEVWELGLDDAFTRAICLVEWPDRLGTHLPPGALHLDLSALGEGRRATLRGGREALRKAALDG